MRKLVVSNAMSLDGYYEGPGKNVMALFDYRSDYPTDECFDAYNAERLREADTLLLGRVSYDGFKGFWPSVADNPDATPLQREISRLNNAIEKVVISDSLTSEETDPWHNTRIISRADAHEQITELKRQAGKDILVFGSRTLWNDLLTNDLVDELHLMIGPVVLSAGTPLFDGASRQFRFGSSTHARGMAQGTYSYGTKPAAKRRRARMEFKQRYPGSQALPRPLLFLPLCSQRREGGFSEIRCLASEDRRLG